MNLRANTEGKNGHYGITYQCGRITNLACNYCNFTVWRIDVSKPKTSHSGLGRYNRMRGIMVEHIHAEHRTELEANPEEGTKP